MAQTSAHVFPSICHHLNPHMSASESQSILFGHPQLQRTSRSLRPLPWCALRPHVFAISTLPVCWLFELTPAGSDSLGPTSGNKKALDYYIACLIGESHSEVSSPGEPWREGTVRDGVLQIITKRVLGDHVPCTRPMKLMSLSVVSIIISPAVSGGSTFRLRAMLRVLSRSRAASRVLDGFFDDTEARAARQDAAS